MNPYGTNLPARDRILRHLESSGGATGSSLATTLNIPAPTVRRAIQDIRRDGLRISDPRDTNGLYVFEGSWY